MAAVLQHANVGPAHIVGQSTGGAIAQLMALDHGDLVRSLSLTSSFASADAHMHRVFSVLRYLMQEADLATVYTAFAMTLFAPEYAVQNPQILAAWIERAAQAPAERDIAIRRIDMILAHDALARLAEIRQPTQIICGDADVLTPLALNRQIAAAIPARGFHIIADGGHLIHIEQEGPYFEAISRFIASLS